MSASSFTFSFTWKMKNFSSSSNEVASPIFTAPRPFEGARWRLWVYPNGCDAGSRGYVVIVLQLVKDNSRRSIRINSLKKLFINYKLGILNNANKLVDHFQDQNDFASNDVSKAKFFMRCRLLQEAETILKGDAMTFRAELVYPEALIQQLVPISNPDGFARLFDTQMFADVTIRVLNYETNCVKELRAHKALLAARSPVFEAMLTREMLETRTNIIEIDDLDFEVVREMVSFMYTGFVGHLEKFAIELLFAADKYDLGDLKDVCVSYLAGNLNSNNVVDVLLTSDLLNIVEMKELCVEMMSASGKTSREYEQFWASMSPQSTANRLK